MEKELFLTRVQDVTTRKAQNNRLIRVFFDTHLGNGHSGLSKIADKENIQVDNLELGEFVVFINTKKSALKMYAPGNIVAHLKLPTGVHLDLGVISNLPRFFNGGKIQYKEALKNKLMKELHLTVNA